MFNNFFFVSGNCTICFQCADGDQNNVVGAYKTCNKFLDNHTCNTTAYADSCVTYISDCKCYNFNYLTFFGNVYFILFFLIK